MTYDVIDPRIRAALRELHDAEYESSTPGADRWRERDDDEFNIARRHRHGRAWDMPPPPKRALPANPPLARVWEAWVAGIALLAWLAFIAWVVFA